ncbi:MAG: ribonuclease HI [Clostridia bacterium]|nr:ribonuclease HI [Clostridia bacterium]MDD4386382.1 ribonuclease HI [Clostridia bacterium]
MRKKIIMYTDGACSGNPGPGGYAAILIYEGNIKEVSGFEKDTTNNKMELTAVIKGLESIKQPCDIEIYSDSTYVVDSVEKGWLFGWLKKNWIKSDKKPVKNVELWIEMLKYLKIHNIKFIKVKGHSDNEYNNRCDKLAVEAYKNM